MISEWAKRIFDRGVDIIFGIILLFIMMGVGIGTAKLFFTTWELIDAGGITGHYIKIITDVLTLYVLIELSRALVEYFTTHKLRLTFILDAAIVFIVREILILLFKHEMKPDMLYALAALLAVLGALRIAAVLVYQREKAMSHDDH
jgi:uncharacterized membrane protein (DUF373 family)